MKVMLVPNLQLGTRLLGPTTDATANRALYQRYANRLQAELGIGFQVYVDTSDGYELLHAAPNDHETTWLTAAAVYAALTPELRQQHHCLSLTDDQILLKATTTIVQQLKQPQQNAPEN